MSALAPGTPAPNFTLKNFDGMEVTLSQFRGRKNVVLAFFPLAFTPVCSCQIPSYRDDLDRFESSDCQVLAIGIGHTAAHKAWVESLGGVTIPVLSDFYPHGEVAKKYGVLREEGFPERAVFLVDKQGVIRYSFVSELRRQPDNQILLEELGKLR
ncbi:MAG: peroxiredoxin [Acidobacteria bacterium]|nr:MAG: peroxiredoxin [Acidobacteriota bacterium]